MRLVASISGRVARCRRRASASARRAEEPPGADRFREHVQPILETYCYGCHGYGSSEGGRTLDEFASDEALLGNIELWWAVLEERAVRHDAAGRRGTAQRRRARAARSTGSSPTCSASTRPIPIPGHVTLRRLNRVEYRNTIRDLMGVDYDTHENFPPDDSGYGFDNIGDVLSLSPLLMEKYIQAAETIVAKARADGVEGRAARRSVARRRVPERRRQDPRRASCRSTSRPRSPARSGSTSRPTIASSSKPGSTATASSTPAAAK